MKLAVIGQGYVGLTLAVNAANVGHKVVGLDTNEDLIHQLLKGTSNVPGIEKSLLRKLLETGDYLPTSSTALLDGAEAIIIAVPTPLNSNRKPELKYLETAAIQIAKFVSNQSLIINESTSYPGTLRNFIKPIITSRSNIKFLYSSAPERIDPGNNVWNLYNTPRVISGLTQDATEKTIELYETFCSSIHRASSPEVAEASKLFENSFRQINIALANEFSVISNTIGFSASEAIIAAATKPFGFMAFYPGVGVGGHCIPIDPKYLDYSSENVDFAFEFVKVSDRINVSNPEYIVKRIKSKLLTEINGKQIQIAGIAYKANISDTRESPALELLNLLKAEGANVTWHDPLVGYFGSEKSTPLKSTIDLGLIITPHEAIDFTPWLNSGTQVMDLSSNNVNYGWPKFL